MNDNSRMRLAVLAEMEAVMLKAGQCGAVITFQRAIDALSTHKHSDGRLHCFGRPVYSIEELGEAVYGLPWDEVIIALSAEEFEERFGRKP